MQKLILRAFCTLKNKMLGTKRPMELHQDFNKRLRMDPEADVEALGQQVRRLQRMSEDLTHFVQQATAQMDRLEARMEMICDTMQQVMAALAKK